MRADPTRQPVAGCYVARAAEARASRAAGAQHGEARRAYGPAARGDAQTQT